MTYYGLEFDARQRHAECLAEAGWRRLRLSEARRMEGPTTSLRLRMARVLHLAYHHRWHNDIMKRTTIVADDDTLDRLRALARERRVSLAEIIRQALADKASEFRPRPRSLGVAESAPSRTSEFSGRVPPRS